MFLTCAPPAQAQSTQETLTQYIADLRKNPTDTALREKIINHVKTMNPAPALPEEARRYFIEGNALVKAAKDQRGYGLAVDAYRECLLIAPWWGEAYNNYAIGLELANQFDNAVNALKLYIASNPGEVEARKAQDKIYEIGAKKKLAAAGAEEGAVSQAAPATTPNTTEALLKKIDGRRYTCTAHRGVIEVKGKTMVLGGFSPMGGYEEVARFEIIGRVGSYVPPQPSHRGWIRQVEGTYTVSEDGETIRQHLRYADGDVRDYFFIWQR
jgi:tetratricopeptide (TPR) repeat protein